jgi:hypothetical protein
VTARGLAIGWLLLAIGFVFGVLLISGLLGASFSFLMWSLFALPLFAATIIRAAKRKQFNAARSIAIGVVWGLLIALSAYVNTNPTAGYVVVPALLLFVFFPLALSAITIRTLLQESSPPGSPSGQIPEAPT